MSKNTCPHCGITFSRPLDRGIAQPFPFPFPKVAAKPISTKEVTPERWFLSEYAGEKTRVGIEAVEAYSINAYLCPKCGQLSIDLLHFQKDENGQDTLIETISIKPTEKERPVPTEVPQPIAQDYREASRITGLSLKGSATLARRCLQATLRHAFPEMPRGKELFDEIEWIINNTDLPKEVKDALHALRKAGNFGAHPAQDGLTTLYELSAEDLDSCFVLLDTLFELLYTSPARKKAKLSSLVDRMFSKQDTKQSSD